MKEHQIERTRQKGRQLQSSKEWYVRICEIETSGWQKGRLGNDLKDSGVKKKILEKR